MTAEEFLAEYERLGHAIQTGVAHEHLGGSKDGSPKHLRTGLNLVMSDLGALTRLLVSKGLITDDEYYAAILAGLRAEVATLEARLFGDSGGRITLA
jgi:hypothetical protein